MTLHGLISVNDHLFKTEIYLAGQHFFFTVTKNL